MNFRALRKSKGLSGYRLAQLSGVRPETISQIENGRVRNPTYGTVSKLAAVLGVTSDVVARAVTATKPRKVAA